MPEAIQRSSLDLKLEYAIDERIWDKVLIAIIMGADPNGLSRAGSPLLKAVQYGRVDVAEALIELGAKVNLQAPADNVGYYESPLHLAAIQCDSKALDLLLAAGATIDIQDSELETPLHMAIRHNRPDLAVRLLERGANPNLQDFQGRTPLHSAVRQKLPEIVKALLAQNADPTIADREGRTPETLARGMGDPTLIAAFGPSKPSNNVTSGSDRPRTR